MLAHDVRKRRPVRRDRHQPAQIRQLVRQHLRRHRQSMRNQRDLEIRLRRRTCSRARCRPARRRRGEQTVAILQREIESPLRLHRIPGAARILGQQPVKRRLHQQILRRCNHFELRPMIAPRHRPRGGQRRFAALSFEVPQHDMFAAEMQFSRDVRHRKRAVARPQRPLVNRHVHHHVDIRWLGRGFRR